MNRTVTPAATDSQHPSREHRSLGQARRVRGEPVPEPVFLLAPARSFSTVSLALLAGHPGIYGFPELLLFSAETVGDLLNEAARRRDVPALWIESRVNGIVRAVAEVHEESQDDAAMARAKAWLTARADWDTVDLMNHLRDAVQPRVALEKSPDTIYSDETLARCLRAYPRAQYIHLTRHPTTTIRSMREHWRKRFTARPEKMLTAGSASAWYLGHGRIIAALESLPAGQWMRVRAEDLLRSPREQLRHILGWLQLDDRPGVIEEMLHTERWRFAGHGTAELLGGGDPKFLRSPALRPVDEPGPLEFDPALGMLAEMERRIIELAIRLGY